MSSRPGGVVIDIGSDPGLPSEPLGNPYIARSRACTEYDKSPFLPAGARHVHTTRYLGNLPVIDADLPLQLQVHGFAMSTRT